MPIECAEIPNGVRVCREVIKMGTREHIESSDVVNLKPGELMEAQTKYASTGKCEHEYIYDTPGYIYDIRYCAVCGSMRGCI